MNRETENREQENVQMDSGEMAFVTGGKRDVVQELIDTGRVPRKPPVKIEYIEFGDSLLKNTK